MKWNGLWVFIGYVYIYIYIVKLAVGWSNNHCKLILAIGLKFGSNMAIRSSYSRWEHFLIVGLS